MANKFIKSEFSKRIGWGFGVAEIPSKEVALDIIKEAQDESSNWREESAEKIFFWSRFCKSPETVEETEVINLIFATFKEIFD